MNTFCVFEEKCACQNYWVSTYLQYSEVEQGIYNCKQSAKLAKQSANKANQC